MIKEELSSEKVMDILITLFMIELFVFGNIAMICVLLHAFGVI